MEAIEPGRIRYRYVLRSEHDRQQLISDLRQVPLEKPLLVLVSPHKEKRTLPQNRGYRFQVQWLCNQLALAALTGEIDNPVTDPDIYHEYFKQKFCPITEVQVGDELYLLQSTTLLNTEQMSEYMEKCRLDAFEKWGFTLPELIPARVREG